MGHKTVINPPRTQWHLGIIGNLRIWSSTSSRRSRWLQQVAVEPSSFAERGAPWMSWDGDRGLMMIDGGKEQPSRRTSRTEEEWKDMIFHCEWLNRSNQINFGVKTRIPRKARPIPIGWHHFEHDWLGGYCSCARTQDQELFPEAWLTFSLVPLVKLPVMLLSLGCP